MEEEKLVGILTDRNLMRASASDATSLEIHELVHLLSKIKAKEIMTKDSIIIPKYSHETVNSIATWAEPVEFGEKVLEFR